ncbi:hypothetical protein G6F65_020063 [Rhizopus arrhizus]|nr:hypothetical protein G6F65_020063 [Rhizopus arrhizus]
MEPRFLQQFQFAHEAEAVDLEDKARIAAGAHAATQVLVFVDELHPQPVVLLPLDLVRGAPAVPVRAVPAALRLEVLPDRLPGVVVVPVGAARAHQVAVGVVDVERGHEGMAQLQELVHDLAPLGRPRLRRLHEGLAGDGEAVVFVAVVVCSELGSPQRADFSAFTRVTAICA